MSEELPCYTARCASGNFTIPETPGDVSTAPSLATYAEVISDPHRANVLQPEAMDQLLLPTFQEYSEVSAQDLFPIDSCSGTSNVASTTSSREDSATNLERVSASASLPGSAAMAAEVAPCNPAAGPPEQVPTSPSRASAVKSIQSQHQQAPCGIASDQASMMTSTEALSRTGSPSTLQPITPPSFEASDTLLSPLSIAIPTTGAQTTEALPCNELHTPPLSPLPARCLTGMVERIGDHPYAQGGFSDVWCGKLSGEDPSGNEKVST